MNAASRLPLPGLLGHSWWILLIYGLLSVAFGILALTRPIATAAVLAWGLGLLAIAEGIISVVALFNRDHGVSRGWLIFYAVASLAFGVLALSRPLAVASVLLFFVAAWLIVGGIYRIVFALRVRKEIKGEWLIIVSGVLAILLGVMFALNPLAGLAVTTFWIGLLALVYGVFQIIAAFRLRKLLHVGPRESLSQRSL
jgi:uncharacterized membrane protein HdeD (DUF308 family)